MFFSETGRLRNAILARVTFGGSMIPVTFLFEHPHPYVGAFAYILNICYINCGALINL